MSFVFWQVGRQRYNAMPLGPELDHGPELRIPSGQEQQRDYHNEIEKAACFSHLDKA